MPTPQKIPAEVETVTDHGGGTYSLALRPLRRLPPHKPGQFLHLALDAYDPSRHWPESRVFSIASAPGTERVELTYSVVGAFTRRMERELAPGGRVWLKLPYGDFVVRPAPEIVLVAGGTGITPFVAYLAQWAATPADHSRVRLAYGARTAALLIYRSVAERCRSARPDFRAVLKSEADDAVPGVSVGRLDIEDIAGLADTPAQATFYLSGPPAMLTDLKEQLRGRMQVPAEHITIDAWT